MLAADDDVGEAEILAIDAVHDRFLRPAVEHLDIEAQQNHPIGHRLAARAPQRRVAVAFAQAALVDQALRRFACARWRGTSSPLVSPISGFEHGPGVVAGPQQRFQAVNQRVFVGPMQRIAGLKRDDAIPALAGQQLADFASAAGCICRAADSCGCGRTWIVAAEQMRLVGVSLQHHVGAGMIGPLGEIDALDVFRLVPRENVADVERGHHLAGRIGQRHRCARLQSARPIRCVTGSDSGIVQA